MNAPERRGMNKIILGFLASLGVAILLQIIFGLIYAGRLDERVANIKEVTNQRNDLAGRVLTNSLIIEKIAETQNTIMDRQRQMELKMARSNR